MFETGDGKSEMLSALRSGLRHFDNQKITECPLEERGLPGNCEAISADTTSVFFRRVKADLKLS